jgi:hypothetical protein
MGMKSPSAPDEPSYEVSWRFSKEHPILSALKYCSMTVGHDSDPRRPRSPSVPIGSEVKRIQSMGSTSSGGGARNVHGVECQFSEL